MKKKSPKVKAPKNEVLRFAHPFYTETPAAERAAVPGIGTRLTDYIKIKLLPIPAPQRDPTMALSAVIGDAGATALANAGAIIFHATGDTGELAGNSQQLVADAMTSDYDIAHPETSPAFFYHLGDVNYYDNTDKGYHAQFYEPYIKYPGKIIGIPGNHDGEIFKFDGTSTGQSKTLQAFMANFCQPVAGVPPAAGTIYREMVSQPGVYWLLQCPFVDIIGLYSNMAENPGFISAKSIGTRQKSWLTKTLKTISKNRKNGTRNALIIAVHHPPFSQGSHSSSTQMLADIDHSCTQAGIMPDAVLAGHSHNMQRYTRYLTFGGRNMQIPFVVCGCGGRQIQPVVPATGARTGDHSYDTAVSSYGYLKVTVTAQTLAITFIEVAATGQKQVFETVTVDLATNSIVPG
ncbi:MAG: metallophosphoesterase family protein [Mucilaginibacter sp.]